MADSDEGLIEGTLARLFALGGAAGRTATALAGMKLKSAFRDSGARELVEAAAWERVGAVLTERLGRLKGAAMKLGQMLSAQEGLLPEPALRALAQLQNSAPPLPLEKLRAQLEAELGERMSAFSELEETAFAAASIGQVHRAKLADGRRVALKIQYPGIDRIVASDFKQLRVALGPLLALATQTDLDPVWEELETTVLAELDYRAELEHLTAMRALHAHDAQLILPAPVPELSSGRVLCLEYEEGLTLAEAAEADETERDQWGATLGRMIAEGVFVHRRLHADPNPGNFAFRPGGKIVLYDFGCVKAIPDNIARGYGAVAEAVLNGRDGEVPAILQGIGIQKRGGETLSESLIAPHADLVRRLFPESGEYRFVADRKLYEEILKLGRESWFETIGVEFPREILFIHRTFAGHLGNLHRLRAGAPWRKILLDSLKQAKSAQP